MWERGVTTKPTGKEDSNTLMAMCTMETGSMTRLMVLEPTLTQTELVTKENGKKIGSMAQESKLGLMARATKASTLKERSMAKASCSSATVAPMRAIS